MADKWTVWGDERSSYFELRRDGWCHVTLSSRDYSLTQIQRVAAILNGEEPAKVEGPWRVLKRATNEPNFRGWIICRGESNIGPCLYEAEGYTQDDADNLASRRNARESQPAKPRYEAIGEDRYWSLLDRNTGKTIPFYVTYPGGPEAAARAEAARLNAAEGGK